MRKEKDLLNSKSGFTKRGLDYLDYLGKQKKTRPQKRARDVSGPKKALSRNRDNQVCEKLYEYAEKNLIGPKLLEPMGEACVTTSLAVG